MTRELAVAPIFKAGAVARDDHLTRFTEITVKGDTVTSPMPADETDVILLMSDGTEVQATCFRDILDPGDFDFVPQRDTEGDSLAPRAHAWKLDPSPLRFRLESTEDPDRFVIEDRLLRQGVLQITPPVDRHDHAMAPLWHLPKTSAHRLAAYLENTCGRARSFCVHCAAAKFRADRTIAAGKLPAAETPTDAKENCP
ncbi:MAG: hypothetical protein ACF8R7_18505 [Phycisphaerales bacterium JB039]